MKTKTKVTIALLVLVVTYVTAAKFASNKDSHAFIFNQALELVNQKELPAARGKFKEYLQGNLTSLRAIYDIGGTYLAQGDYQSAVPYFEVSWRLGWDDSLKSLGACLLNLNQLKSFADILPDLTARSAQDPDALALIENYAFKVNDQELFRKTISKFSDDFLKRNPVDLDGIIAACDQWHLDELKDKYTKLKESIPP